MRILILFMLMLSLFGCTALPNIHQTAAPEQSTITEAPQEPEDPYALFLGEVLKADKVTLLKEYFSDIHAGNASYFFISAALAELNGDQTPEILLTFSNETIEENAQSLTQVYRLQDGAFVKFGDKLTGSPSFYQAGRMLMTQVEAMHSQGTHQYQLVEITEEVRVIESGEYRYYFARAAQEERPVFDQLVNLAKSAVIGSSDEQVRVIYLENRLENLLMFNDKQYSYDKAKAMVQRLLEMKRVHLQPLTDEFLQALEDYKREPFIEQVMLEEQTRDLTDQYVRAVDAKLADPNFTRIQVGESEYVVESTSLAKSLDLFTLIYGRVEGKEVYFRNDLPVYYRSNKLGYYADDKNLSEVFAQIKRQFDRDAAQYYLSDFFLTDAYSGTLSWPLYQTEYFQ